MYIRIVRRRALENGGVAVIAVSMVVLLLQYPEAVQNGINRGLSVCGTVIIPTLFPFMLLAGWLAESPLCRHPGSIARRVASKVFGLPGCCAPAILLSLVGGYPAGMVAISRLYKQGQINREELKRMTAFCVCGGPGFIVGTVGIGLMGNTHAGWLLYAAQAATAVGIGIWLGRGHRRCTETDAPLPPRRPFAVMVSDTCGALLSMCGFVAAAAMVLSLLEGIGVARGIAAVWGGSAATVSGIMAGILEVSCGCIALAGMPQAPLWLSLCLGWGGLSIHGQLAAALPGEKVITPRFLRWRLVQGIISSGLAWGLFALFPPKQSVGVHNLSPLPFTVSAAASHMMLVLCFLTMLCFSEKKGGKNTEDVLYCEKWTKTDKEVPADAPQTLWQ